MQCPGRIQSDTLSSVDAMLSVCLIVCKPIALYFKLLTDLTKCQRTGDLFVISRFRYIEDLDLTNFRENNQIFVISRYS